MAEQHDGRGPGNASHDGGPIAPFLGQGKPWSIPKMMNMPEKATAMASQRMGVMASPRKTRAMIVAQTGLK